jgi:hypothetical protein
LFLSKLDLLLILSDNTTAATDALQTVTGNVSGFAVHAIRLSNPCVLDCGQYSIYTTKHAECDARAVNGSIAQHVCWIFSLVPQTQPILGFAIDDARTEKARHANGRLSTGTKSVLP